MPALLQSTMDEKNEDHSSSSIDESLINPENNRLPLVAVPEKIIICVDMLQDSAFKSFKKSDGSSIHPFVIMKKALANFIHNKHILNNEHKFAVMSLEGDTVKWVQDFSSDPSEVIKAVNDLQIIILSDPTDVNITNVFSEIKRQVGNLPEVRINTVQFPSHIVRLLFLYNSSYNVPIINESDDSYLSLTSSNYFIWDSFYLHDPPSGDNKCQEIYDVLLETASSSSYVFETSRSIVKLFNTMAKYLSHPLQRANLQ